MGMPPPTSSFFWSNTVEVSKAITVVYIVCYLYCHNAKYFWVGKNWGCSQVLPRTKHSNNSNKSSYKTLVTPRITNNDYFQVLWLNTAKQYKRYWIGTTTAGLLVVQKSWQVEGQNNCWVTKFSSGPFCDCGTCRMFFTQNLWRFSVLHGGLVISKCSFNMYRWYTWM